MIALAILLSVAAGDLPSPASRERVAAAQQLTGEGGAEAASTPDTLYTRGTLVRWGRVLGTMGAAVGVIALGVATGLLVNASSLDHQRHLLCPTNPCTEPAAYDLYARAGTSQNFGVVFAAIGGGLLAAGALLFFFKGDF